MANILPRELDPAALVTEDGSLIIDNGVTVQKATPVQIVDAGRPNASQAEAEAGAENSKSMTALRVAQALAAQAWQYPGPPGGSFDVGILNDLPMIPVPAGTNLIAVSGAKASGDFAASQFMVEDATIDDDYVAAAPNRAGKDSTGRYFREVAPEPTFQPQIADMWQRIRAEQADVSIFYCGDSTGDADDEHPRLRAIWFAAKVPTHTVIYRKWVDGSSTWSAPETISTGTGSKNIYLDNCSVSGASGYYLEGARRDRIFDGSREYSLVVVTYGHNYGTTVTEAQLAASFVGQLSVIQALAPRAGVLVTLQNPRIDAVTFQPIEQTKAMTANWLRAARMLGCGVIDVYNEFLRHPNFTIPPGTAGSLYLDDGTGTHPDAFGQEVWLAAEDRALREPSGYTMAPIQMQSPLLVQKPCLAPNALFSDWPAGQAAPTSWTLNNVTATKDTGRLDGGPYTLRLTNGAGTSPQISADVSAYLTRLRGKYVTLVVRGWKSSGLDDLAGRCSITVTGSASPGGDTAPRRLPGESVDGWFTAVATGYIPLDATGLTLAVPTGASAGTDNGETFNISRIWFGEGVLPGAVNPLDYPVPTVEELYDAANTGIPNGYNGTLVATGTSITMSGATGVGIPARVYINLPGVIPGERYKATWTHVSDTGNGGTVLLRNGLNGVGASGASATWSTGSLTFTAFASGPCNLMLSGNALVSAFSQTGWSVVALSSGLRATNLSFADALNADGSVIDATGGASKFALSTTLGTSKFLQSETSTGNTKTCTVWWEVTLPSNYLAGRQLTVTVNAQVTGTGTLGTTKTLDVKAYAMSADGSMGSDLGPVTQALTTSATTYTYYTAGTGLTPGGKVLIGIETAVQETGATNPIRARVNSVVLS